MIVLDNVAKQFGVNENFQPFTEKVQVLFDELKEEFPGIIRLHIYGDITTVEKEIDGLSGVIEQMATGEGLLSKVEASFINDVINIEEKSNDLLVE